MKSVPVKKVLSSLLLILMLGLFVTTMRPVSAEAETVSLTRKDFAVSYISSSSVSFKLALPYNNIQGVVQLFENGKLVGKTTAYSSATINYAVKKNKTYFYRVRPIYQGKYIGGWSPRKAFSTVMLKLQQKYGGTRTLKVTVPKMSGVKSVTLLMSTSKTSGYKKWKTLKPGKARSCRSVNGKKFVTGTTYYIRAKVNLKNGTPCESAYVQNYYFYNRTY